MKTTGVKIKYVAKMHTGQNSIKIKNHYEKNA